MRLRFAVELMYVSALTAAFFLSGLAVSEPSWIKPGVVLKYRIGEPSLLVGYRLFTSLREYAEYMERKHGALVIVVDDPKEFNVTEYREKTEYKGLLVILPKRGNGTGVHVRYSVRKEIGRILNATYIIRIIDVQGGTVLAEASIDAYIEWSPSRARQLEAASHRLTNSVRLIIDLNTREARLPSGERLSIVPWWIGAANPGDAVNVTDEVAGRIADYWGNPVATGVGRVDVWFVELNYTGSDFKLLGRGWAGQYMYEKTTGILVAVVRGLYFDPRHKIPDQGRSYRNRDLQRRRWR